MLKHGKNVTVSELINVYNTVMASIDIKLMTISISCTKAFSVKKVLKKLLSYSNYFNAFNNNNKMF